MDDREAARAGVVCVVAVVDGNDVEICKAFFAEPSANGNRKNIDQSHCFLFLCFLFTPSPQKTRRTIEFIKQLENY